MAYARATVAGFEVEQMDDLICFANAFGASRLRYNSGIGKSILGAYISMFLNPFNAVTLFYSGRRALISWNFTSKNTPIANGWMR